MACGVWRVVSGEWRAICGVSSGGSLETEHVQGSRLFIAALAARYSVVPNLRLLMQVDLAVDMPLLRGHKVGWMVGHAVQE